jgi:hypothetical protein
MALNKVLDAGSRTFLVRPERGGLRVERRVVVGLCVFWATEQNTYP